MKLRAWLFAGLCCVAFNAQAGLFSDDEARKRIQDVETRIPKLEEALAVLDEAVKQQTRSLLDLQTQIESVTQELRKLRGQNEEFAHNLQDAEKRQKDFYVDLDTRLRHFEAEPTETPSANVPADKSVAAQDDPAVENRTLEAAYALYKTKSYPSAINAFLDFLKKYPESVQVPNVRLWLGNAYLAIKDYPSALTSLQAYLELAPNSAKAPEAMLSVAIAEQESKQLAAAKKTLKKLIAQYPASEAAGKAKGRLAAIK
ncbi:MAG: tol-pal system protein YbgF [Nitrosomonadales bacterium]|nr:tol-pal system protein YbgF [Nitrosomonadales bacterium]